MKRTDMLPSKQRGLRSGQTTLVVRAGLGCMVLTLVSKRDGLSGTVHSVLRYTETRSRGVRRRGKHYLCRVNPWNRNPSDRRERQTGYVGTEGGLAT